MSTTPHHLVAVATRVESDLAAQLEAKARAADRSLAAEIRQAIRAWVEAESERAAA